MTDVQNMTPLVDANGEPRVPLVLAKTRRAKRVGRRPDASEGTREEAGSFLRDMFEVDGEGGFEGKGVRGFLAGGEGGEDEGVDASWRK
jgi:hypothetical protein